MDLSHCTSSEYDDEGFLGIQADVYASQGRGDTPGHHLSPGGLDHRPVDPQGEIGELCWKYDDGHQYFVFPLNDVRTEHALPNLNKGATRLFDTGTFGEFPFRTTFTLDPVAKNSTWEAHREGDKLTIKNAEGVQVEFTGTSFKITGATSIECGGQTPLALATLVASEFGKLKTAISSAAAFEKGASGMGGMGSLEGFVSSWPSNVAATVAKGG